MFKIATWNVNSIKSRINHVLAFIQEHSPDVLMLQELKCTEDAFPKLEFEDLGYNCAIFGQKTYNGVAILSKYRIEDVLKGFPEFEDDQARYIECVISVEGRAIRVASVYVPNGQSIGSDKYDYKMLFLERLNVHLQSLYELQEITIIVGDYNIASDEIDLYDHHKFEGSICFSHKERVSIKNILNIGYYDAFRARYPDQKSFTWWDYRAGAFQKNEGMRIDYTLLSPEALDLLVDVQHVKSLRKLEKASDHVPEILFLNI
jgi:exodeoxyribonuclease III